MDLSKKIKDKEVHVGIIGLGYVGLPLAMGFLEKGLKVLGIDEDRQRIEQLRRGVLYLSHVSEKRFSTVVDRGRWEVAEETALYNEADVYCITVPTPLDSAFNPDLSQLEVVAKRLRPYLEGKLIILECSGFPGLTQEWFLPALEPGTREVGRDFFLAYSPERVDPGNSIYDQNNTPRLLAGVTSQCRELALSLYRHLTAPLHPMNHVREAEMAKALENTFRAINIAFVNEMARFCHHLGMDIWEVLKGAGSKPFGYMPFWPGPGAGGHCIPVDPLYLLWRGDKARFPLRFIRLAWEINLEQPIYVLFRLQEELEKRGQTLRGAKILILGVAYKENVGDIRESTALTIMEELQKRGAHITYSDPHVPELVSKGRLLKSQDLILEEVQDQHGIILHTPHAALDYELLSLVKILILDCRNVLGPRDTVVPL